MTADPLRFRAPELLTAILDTIYEDEDADPVPWTDLVHNLTSTTHQARTIEATLYDLIAAGAIHRIGKAPTRRQDDTRALKQTTLGAAWYLGTDLPPHPTERTNTP